MMYNTAKASSKWQLSTSWPHGTLYQ